MCPFILEVKRSLEKTMQRGFVARVPSGSQTQVFLTLATSCQLSLTPEDTGWGDAQTGGGERAPQNTGTLSWDKEDNKAIIMTQVTYPTSFKSAVFMKIWLERAGIRATSICGGEGWSSGCLGDVEVEGRHSHISLLQEYTCCCLCWVSWNLLMFVIDKKLERKITETLPSQVLTQPYRIKVLEVGQKNLYF